jgi:hypothetical protein
MSALKVNPDAFQKAAQHSVHLTLGSLRVFQAFSLPQPFSHPTAFRHPPQRK